MPYTPSAPPYYTTMLLVGESPPPNALPDFAPFDCDAGDRLAKILCGFASRAPLLEHVQRANIFRAPGTGLPGGPPWDGQAAIDRAAEIVSDLASRVVAMATIVALGRRPADAFASPALQFGTWTRLNPSVDLVVLPHPSGRSTRLNDQSYRATMRRTMMCELVIDCPGLRPWHFRIDEPAILVDLAHAVAPNRPRLAAAALVIAAEVHRAAESGAPSEIIDRHAVDFSMRELAVLCAEGFDALALSWSRPDWRSGDQPSRKVISELRSRERFINTNMAAAIAAYPIDAARATYGRHVARGIA